MLTLNPSYRHHFLVALIIALWLVAFLVLIAPFDIAELPFSARVEIMPTYGLIAFVAYVMLIPLQNWIFKKKGKWTIFLELFIIILFNCLALIGSYFYYKSNIVNGNYTFIKFTFEVYYPILLILLPILIFVRWFLNKKMTPKISENIVLSGDNKFDVLQLPFSDLICISSADNYVEVNYLVSDKLHKKLLRTTLKNSHSEEPRLLKAHRSYLVNPLHFKEWKNANTLILTHMEIPVSKRYKQKLMSVDYSSLKPDSLSQTQ